MYIEKEFQRGDCLTFLTFVLELELDLFCANPSIHCLIAEVPEHCKTLEGKSDSFPL